MSADGAAQRIRDQRNDEDRRADDAHSDDEGLSSQEAGERRERYGANVLAEEEHNLLLEIGSHFWGPIPWMIEAALVLTAVTAKWTDFGIIAALLLLNGGVGFWEEHQARGSIEALKQRLAKQAKVKRDGEWHTVAAAELVPGDLVAVKRGDVIPADAVIVDGRGESDESSLTGESLPVQKQPDDEIYSGAVLVRGGPVARVMATGSATVFGRTAELAGKEPPTSHFQQAVISIGKYLIVLALALVAIIVVVSLLRGASVADTLEFALVVTIASVPVALPAVLSVTMAVGARHLAQHEAVVATSPPWRRWPVSTCCARTRRAPSPRTSWRWPRPQSSPRARAATRSCWRAALTARAEKRDLIDRAMLSGVERPRRCRRTRCGLPAVRSGPQARRGDSPRRRRRHRSRWPRGRRRPSSSLLDRGDEDGMAANSPDGRSTGSPAGATARSAWRAPGGGGRGTSSGCSRSRTRRASTRGRRSHRRAP